MEGGRLRSEHSLSKGSEVRKGRASLEKDKQMGNAGVCMRECGRGLGEACNGGKGWRGAKWGRIKPLR